MSSIILNTTLGASFQPSLPVLIPVEKVVLDFKITIPGRDSIRVQWYPEFSEDSPTDPNVEWYREVAEEDIGNGDVRMPIAIRRFSTEGADADLPPGTYFLSVQFKRSHKICRIQMAGAGAAVVVKTVFGDIPTAP